MFQRTIVLQNTMGLFLLLFLIAPGLSAQAARTDGEAVVYYDSLREAFHAAVGGAEYPQGSYDHPVEITLLADVVLDEPLIVPDGVHIRLVAGGVVADGGLHRRIWRGGGNVEFPVIWVKGEGARLSLGSPAGMEYELIIDGGRFAEPPLQAHAPLVTVSGPDSKLIMYDGVTLQNNYNRGTPEREGMSFYQNGAGVFVRTEGDVQERQAEFIMKGGTIRGNFNDVTTYLAVGGGVLNMGFGIFTMEGGVIAGNTIHFQGAGFAIGSRSSFKKTGGIIYGKNAPAGLRNVSLKGNIAGAVWPKIHGHALSVTNTKPVFIFRDDTVWENDHLSYAGVARGDGVFGEGEKWDNSDSAFRRWLFTVILITLVFGVGFYFVFTKIYLKKRLAHIMRVADTAPLVDLSGFNLTEREKEVCKLLLTDLSYKEIGSAVGIKKPTVNFHANNLYRKLGIQSRTELYVKLTSNR